MSPNESLLKYSVNIIDSQWHWNMFILEFIKKKTNRLCGHIIIATTKFISEKYHQGHKLVHFICVFLLIPFLMKDFCLNIYPIELLSGQVLFINILYTDLR